MMKIWPDLTLAGSLGEMRQAPAAGAAVHASRQPAVFTIGFSGAAVGVTVEPHAAAVKTGGSAQFTASVTGTANIAVTWKVIEADVDRSDP